MEHSPVHTHTQGLTHSHVHTHTHSDMLYDKRKYPTTSKERSVLCQLGQIKEGGASEGTGYHDKREGGRKKKCHTNPEPLLS